MTNQELATLQAAGLRALAKMIEENPNVADRFADTLNRSGINVHLDYHNNDKAGQLAELARIALRHGARVEKDIDERWHNLIIHLRGIKLHVLAYRNEVCERIVVGTETVTKTVPDPEKLAEVPQIEVTEEVEQVEWQCKPLLAADMADA